MGLAAMVAGCISLCFALNGKRTQVSHSGVNCFQDAKWEKKVPEGKKVGRLC
jgi:hypothetical protein